VIISLIVALNEKGGISLDNRIPWKLSEDLKRFKRITMGHHLIMGRKTYEAIGRSLPGRTTIIMSRNPGYKPEPGCEEPDCMVAHSLKEAFRLAKSNGEDEVFVIGGGEIYSEALSQADRIYFTIVHMTGPADVFFPKLKQRDWVVIDTSYQPADEKNQYASTFQLLGRKQKTLA
jgi:dihydrofolate reductase